MRITRPLIGVVSDRRRYKHHFHIIGEKYLTALTDAAGAFPVGIPSLGGDLDLLPVLERLDGLLLTGSPSNVEPHHYKGTPSRPGTLHDPERDRTTFTLLPAAIKAGLPVLAICRGFQEMNVAFGGTLHQAVQEVPGLGIHREDPGHPLERQYAPAHDVRFTAGGLLERITGRSSDQVNSVHSQGIDELGEGLEVEAVAPDGLIEAIVVRDSPGFTLGVQWHPEWKVKENPTSIAIFQAFGEASRRYRTGA